MLKLNSQLPSLDWQEALRRANQKPELAQELMKIFAGELPDFLVQIEDSYAQRDIVKMQAVLHKLLGGCNYCGTLRLREFVKAFEQDVRANPEQDFQQEIDQLKQEIPQVLTAFSERLA